jgi:Domain of unknown function (DUF6916)
MALQRRKFLKAGILFAGSAALALGTARLGFAQKARGRVGVGGPRIPIAAQEDAVFMFTRATFDPYVGGFFQAPNARGEMVSLKLLKAESYIPKRTTQLSTGRAIEVESFSLLFSASESLPPFTSIHKISHPALGEFSLFLTRRDGVNGEILYEAVFNHVR